MSLLPPIKEYRVGSLTCVLVSQRRTPDDAEAAVPEEEEDSGGTVAAMVDDCSRTRPSADGLSSRARASMTVRHSLHPPAKKKMVVARADAFVWL